MMTENEKAAVRALREYAWEASLVLNGLILRGACDRAEVVRARMKLLEGLLTFQLNAHPDVLP